MTNQSAKRGGRGGRRPGSGPKPGSHRPYYWAQQRMLQRLRERVEVDFDAIVNALVDTAKGAFVFLARRGDEFVVLTDPKAIRAAVAAGREHYRIECKAPDQRALKEVLDRALGRVTDAPSEDGNADQRPARVIYEFPAGRSEP